MQLMQGDCLEQLKCLPRESVDALVTDPPAGIGFMGKEWDQDKGGRDAWIAWMRDVMREAYAVLKPGAHGLIWALPRTSHWTATALEDAGFEIRDVVTHLFGQGFPKSLDISKAIDKAAGAERQVIGRSPNWRPAKTKGGAGFDKDVGEGSVEINLTVPATDAAKQWQGWGTALKPASEHWILVRKPIAEKNVAANVLKHGTGGINIDASRIASEQPNPSIARRMSKPRVAVSACGWENKGSDEAYAAPHPGERLGRFPANLVLSHSPHCTDDQCDIECAIAMLDEQSGTLKAGVAVRSKSGGKNFGSEAEKPPLLDMGYGGSGGASRFFYCAKISTSERGEGNSHPTVKAKKLMSYLIRMVTPPGGTVLDPFMGSGSTGIAAREGGFQFIGIEREPEYFEIAKKRLGAEA